MFKSKIINLYLIKLIKFHIHAFFYELLIALEFPLILPLSHPVSQMSGCLPGTTYLTQIILKLYG